MIAYLIDKTIASIVTMLIVLGFMLLFDKERFKKKWFWVVLFVVYINATMVIVGAPNFMHKIWEPSINYIPFQNLSESNIMGMLLNVNMFIPFGALISIYFDRYKKFFPALFACFLMSLTIEVLQLFTFRATDVDDLIMNTIGGIIGYLLVAPFVRKSYSKDAENKDALKLFVIVVSDILVIYFLGYQLSGLAYSLLYQVF